MLVCPHCAALNAETRVRINHKPWGNSPEIWLSGNYADLQTLISAGKAIRNPAGWYVPTDKMESR